MAVVRMPDPPRDLAAMVEQRQGLLNVQDLVRLTRFGKTAIYEMVAAGRIPYLRFDSSIRFDPIAIAAWMREHTVLLAA
jgi:predicted DNA-binding transcriptional regulator AlpA